MIKYSGYSAECDTLEELLKAVSRLPNTIKSVSVQSSLEVFQPSSVKLEWTNNIKSLVQIIIEEAILEEHQHSVIDKFYLRSYFGPGGKNDPYYISLSTDKSRKFGQKMADGHYGSLD